MWTFSHFTCNRINILYGQYVLLLLSNQNIIQCWKVTFAKVLFLSTVLKYLSISFVCFFISVFHYIMEEYICFTHLHLFDSYSGAYQVWNWYIFIIFYCLIKHGSKGVVGMFWDFYSQIFNHSCTATWFNLDIYFHLVIFYIFRH